MTSEFLQWIFNEFIPFGDLVSDVALIVTLPSRDEADTFFAPAKISLFVVMRWLLWVGTLVSAIPEISLFVGIFSGIVIGATLGPASQSTGENNNGKKVLWSNIAQMGYLSRYIFSDGKTISRFILYLTKDVTWEWESAVTLVVHYAFFVPLFAVTYPLVCCGKISRNPADHPWYGPLILVQVVGGLMTEVSSIYFAISTRDTLSIISASFGLYYLVISTMHAFLKGPKGTTEELSFPQRRDELAAASGTEFREAGSAIGNVLLLILVIGFGAGFIALPFFGVYFLETGEQKLGRILTSVGFTLFGLVVLCACLVANADDDDVDENAAGIFLLFMVAILLIGLGVVYAITAGFTPLTISLLAVGGVLVLCAGCAGLAD